MTLGAIALIAPRRPSTFGRLSLSCESLRALVFYIIEPNKSVLNRLCVFSNNLYEKTSRSDSERDGEREDEDDNQLEDVNESNDDNELENAET